MSQCSFSPYLLWPPFFYPEVAILTFVIIEIVLHCIIPLKAGLRAPCKTANSTAVFCLHFLNMDLASWSRITTHRVMEMIPIELMSGIGKGICKNPVSFQKHLPWTNALISSILNSRGLLMAWFCVKNVCIWNTNQTVYCMKCASFSSWIKEWSIFMCREIFSIWEAHFHTASLLGYLLNYRGH